MIITSIHNPDIKNLVKLSTKSRERKKQQLIVVEGLQENEYALAHGFMPEAFYLHETLWENALDLHSAPFKYVDQKVYSKIAYRDKTEGIIGVYQWKENPIHWEKASLVLVLERLEKPGNFGAILRSALAFGVDGIVLSDSLIDIFNPNVIRSSVGTVFSLPIESLNNTQSKEKIQQNQFSLYATHMQRTAQNLSEVQFEDKTALLFGNEHAGLSTFWENSIQKNFLIPMQNNIDSLNLSNAVAITLYQYQTQKKLNT